MAIPSTALAGVWNLCLRRDYIGRIHIEQERKMQHLDFVIWMIGWPLMFSVIRSPGHDNIMAFCRVLGIIAWFVIGYKLW